MVTATFLTEDSYLGEITNPLTLNRYNYTLSNYLNYQDPSGHINEFTDYGEVSDSLRYLWNLLWKDDAVTASIAENRAYRKEEDRLEMSFCAGGMVSAFWYGLDMVALPTLILYNNYAPKQYEVGYGEYFEWRENTETYIDNQTGNFIDTNMYYTGRCSTEMVIVATEIIGGGVALGSSLNKVLNKGDDVLRVGQEVVDDVIDAIDDDSKAIVDDVIDAIDDGRNNTPDLDDLIDNSAGANDGVDVLDDVVESSYEKSNSNSEISQLLSNKPELIGTNREKLLSTVQNSKLYSLIDQLYRPDARIGDGGTADKLVSEFYQGTSEHLIKAKGRLTEVTRLINSGTLNLNDLDIAEAIRDDLENAINLFM